MGSRSGYHHIRKEDEMNKATRVRRGAVTGPSMKTTIKKLRSSTEEADLS